MDIKSRNVPQNDWPLAGKGTLVGKRKRMANKTRSLGWWPFLWPFMVLGPKWGLVFASQVQNRTVAMLFLRKLSKPCLSHQLLMDWKSFFGSIVTQSFYTSQNMQEGIQGILLSLVKFISAIPCFYFFIFYCDEMYMIEDLNTWCIKAVYSAEAFNCESRPAYLLVVSFKGSSTVIIRLIYINSNFILI